MRLIGTLLAQDGGFRLWPETASTTAEQIDLVYMALLGLLLFFVVLIGALALGFGVKYRAGTDAYRDDPIRSKYVVEITWIALPTLMTLMIFIWAAYVFVQASTPPPEARTIYVVGKQWMWKVQHPGGRREINELHVPTGEPVKLVLTSQDVIHSFFVPAFRIKQDALPQRYTSLWFEATQPGTYHFFCAEYCGAEHARMRGRVVVLEPGRFQQWLQESPPLTEGFAAAGSPTSPPRGGSDVQGVFERFGCHQCHQDRLRTDTPQLAGLFGQRVALRDGRTVVADENYIRRAIVEPNAEVPVGYDAPSIMPTYDGQIDAEEMIALIEYIKMMKAGPRAEASP